MIIKAYRWYGGKIRMVIILNLLIPEHRAYFEPFMGSAALLLNHPRSEREVINDLDTELVHFMKTLADREKGKKLSERLYGLEYGKSFFMEALEWKKKHYRGLDDIEKAAMIFTTITQSFNSTRKSFANRQYEDTFKYRQDIQLNIPEVYKRLKDVCVYNMNGIDLLADITDNSDAFAFVDPPYRKELRGAGADKVYACELPHREQIRLLKTIQCAKCKIMLCGYREEKGVDLYDTYLLPHGWKCYKLADVTKSCQASKKHRDIGHEFIWVNYKLPCLAKCAISMKEYSSI